jgi:carboxylate-amine ligase
MELVREDAEALGCLAELEHLKQIVARGTSAHQQVKCYDDAISAGKSEDDALKAVVDHLVSKTSDI